MRHYGKKRFSKKGKRGGRKIRKYKMSRGGIKL